MAAESAIGLDARRMAGIDEGRLCHRRARASDLPVLKRLYREAFELNWPHAQWRRGVRRAVAWRLRQAVEGSDGHQVHVIERAGRLLGYIWWQTCTAPDGAPAATVHGIGVLEEERRRGLGQQLAQIMGGFIALQGQRMQAMVRPNNAPVIRLLEKFGAEVTALVFTVEPAPVRKV